MINVNVSTIAPTRGLGQTRTAVQIFNAVEGAYLVVNFLANKLDVCRYIPVKSHARVLVKNDSHIRPREETVRQLSALPPGTVVVWDIL
jgi:hypothetical protein